MSFFMNKKISLATQINRNWRAGVTVSLVSLPLSISLAVAANATPVMGVVTAIWAGLVAAIFGGSHHNVIGPTGALSGILAMYAIIFGVGVLPVIAVLAGLLIMACYFFRIDRYIIFIPASVVHGFTLGVAFIIGLNQFNFATGLKGLPQHERFIYNIIESFRHITQANLVTVGICLTGLALLFLFLKLKTKVPGPIIVALLGIGLGYAQAHYGLDWSIQTLYSKFGTIQTTLFHFSPIPWGAFINIHLWGAALAVTVIAILETLISGKIAAGMSGIAFGQRREVFGLGLANVASGLTGGIPATGALARTALNIKTGATHRTSGIINAVIVAVVSLLFLPYFSYLPLAVVGAILIYVAIRMIEAEHFVKLYRHSRFDFLLAMVTALITIIVDPIIGILVGAVIALLYFVNQLSKAQSEITVNKNKQVVARLAGGGLEAINKLRGDVIVYRFAGQMTYVNATAHQENIKNLTSPVVVLSFRNLFYLDLDGMETLGEIVDMLVETKKDVYITGVGSAISKLVTRTSWYKNLDDKGRVFESTSAALRTLGYKV